MNSILIAESWSFALSKHLIEQKDKEGGNESTADRPIILYNNRLSLSNNDSVVKV